MAGEIIGGTDEPINYGMGTGWLDYANLLSQMLTQQGAAQGSVGTSVLSQLGNFLTSPTAGPLGLAATAAYGNPQGIAGATGGKGLDNSKYTSRYDKLLDDLLGYAGNINAGPEQAPAKIDPNNAPAITPQSAASAPNVAQDWIKAWEAYRPGTQHPDRAAVGLKEGGEVELNKDGSKKILNPVDRMLERSSTINKAMKSLADVSHLDDANGNGIPDSQENGKMHGGKVPGYDDGGLVQLATAAQGLAPDKQDEFWLKMRRLGELQEYMKESNQAGGPTQRDTFGGVPGTRPSAVRSFSPIQRRFQDAIGAGMPGSFIPSLQSLPPDIIEQLMNQFTEVRNGQVERMADGGVTVGGGPHWIVDENGYPVAAITEDGAPENVRGLQNGGVEVTPLRPDRFEQYTGQAPGESDIWGRMLARMKVDGVPGAVTGAQIGVPGNESISKFMFPDIPGSMVDTSPEAGTNQIPSWGGATEAIDRGQSWTPGSPTSLEDLFAGVGNAPGANRNEQYARIMGGALQHNTLMGDAGKALNQGNAPTNLPSRQQLASMAPSQRAGYMAMLQQMGIISGPEDFAHYVNQFTPAGLKWGGWLKKVTEPIREVGRDIERADDAIFGNEGLGSNLRKLGNELRQSRRRGLGEG